MSDRLTNLLSELANLQAENARLRDRLKTLKTGALETEALFERVQRLEMQLLAIPELDRLLDAMTTELQAWFRVDQARLLLADPGRRVRTLLASVQARVPPGVLFEPLPAELCALRQPYLMTADSRGLPPIVEPGTEVRSLALLPLIRGEEFLGLLGLGSRDGERFRPDLQTHALARLAAICSVCLENAVNRARLEIGGLTDPLTGLHNRRSLEQHLNAELARARRSREPLSCLFLDLDLFKTINDNHGHAAGDAVLCEVARRLLSTLRSGDVAARFGGDELAVLLPGAAYQDALGMAERIRALVSADPCQPEPGLSIPVSLSIGVGTLETPDNDGDLSKAGQVLLRAADQALYRAKRGGRGRVN